MIRALSTTGDHVWCPFVDAPILTAPMLLGLDHAEPDDRNRLIEYLGALLDVRAAPIHVNVAFNAAYFGFDLQSRSYPGGIELDDLSTVDTAGVVDALPVGALIQVKTGAGPLLGEVLYKEGAHRGLGPDGHVPAWLSGAPSGATGPGQRSGTDGPVSLRERLIVDVDAFGAGLSLTSAQVERARRRGRVIDPDGHLVLDVLYASALEADMDESTYFARYLLSAARAQLLAPAVPMPLSSALRPGATADQLEAGLIGLLDTIQTALSRVEAARTWRGYAFTRAGLAERLADGGALGGADLRQVANQVQDAASSSRPSRWAVGARTAVYTAVGPLLRTLAGSGPALEGLGYASAVCHANAVIWDDARHEVDEGGLLPGQVHLRLDDAWQGGGVWRAEQPGSTHVGIEVGEPLGLGWASTLPQAPDLAALGESETDLEAAVEIRDEESPLDLSVTDSQVTWKHVLRLSHQIEGRLPLPDCVVTHLRTVDRPGVRTRVTLRHDGYALSPASASQLVNSRLHDASPCLDGIDWPLEYFPAIVLLCTWPRGSGVIHMTSTLLAEPVVVDGLQIDHRYDPRALTRDQSGGPAPGGPKRPPTVAAMVLAAVRAVGLLDVEGRATLAHALVPLAFRQVHGHAPEFDVTEAIDELARAGLLTTAEASGSARDWSLPPVPGEPSMPLVVYTPRLEPGVSRAGRKRAGTLLSWWVADARVQSHLRRIGDRRASAAQAAAYRADHERFGLSGSPELPEGYTYVVEHERRGHER